MQIDNFILFFLIWRTFFFSCLISLARTFSSMMNNGESRHPSLVFYIKGKAFSFMPLGIILVVGLTYIAFIMLRCVPPILLRVFIMNEYWIFFKCLFCLYWDNIIILFFILLMWWNTLIDLQMLNHPCISGINPIDQSI